MKGDYSLKFYFEVEDRIEEYFFFERIANSKYIAMKFKGKCFIYNKLHIKQNITKISLNKFFFKKGTVTQANVAEIDNL